MIKELAREADTRIKEVLVELRGLGWVRAPTGAIPKQSMSVEILEPVHPCGSREGPGFVPVHDFCVNGRVALMVVQVCQCGGGAIALFLVPDADVMGIGAHDQQQSRCQRLVPVRYCAEFIVGRQ